MKPANDHLYIDPYMKYKEVYICSYSEKCTVFIFGILHTLERWFVYRTGSWDMHINNYKLHDEFMM